MPYPLLIFSHQITWFRFFIQIHLFTDKQCRSRSVCFFRSQLIWIYTVCKGRVYPGSAGLVLMIVFIVFQNIQQALEQRQAIVDSLTTDVESLRSLVEKSRPGVARHHDLEVLEKDVSNIMTRWGNVKEQVNERYVFVCAYLFLFILVIFWAFARSSKMITQAEDINWLVSRQQNWLINCLKINTKT